MKIKTRDELSELDKELNLFSEDEWDFLDTSNTADINLEYFDDFGSEDFRKRGVIDIAKTTVTSLMVCAILMASGVWLYNITVGRHILTNGDTSSVSDIYKPLERVNGKSVSNEEYIGISKVISSYFGVLNIGSNYDLLNSFCSDSSNFYDTEKHHRSEMKFAYDINDCYARVLRCFGKYISMSKIVDIRIKNNKYYVYTSINYPDNTSLTEYFYVYSNDMTKFFNTNEITQQNIIRYIVQLADTYGLPTSSSEICIEVKRTSSNEYKITNDSIITDQITDSYNYAVSQAIKILGGSKALTQFD